MKVLVTGIAGAIGQLLTLELLDAGFSVCGLDIRTVEEPPFGVRVFRGDLRSATGQEVFRKERPQAVIHLASTSPSDSSGVSRPRKNLGLTRELVDAVARHGVRSLVFVGRHLYYGAAADLPAYHREQDPPHGVETYPEAADLVAADLMVGAALWTLPGTRIAILRVCHPLGPSPRGLLAQLLRGTRVPTVLGFDPLVQFLHASDIALAIRLSLQHGLRGVYNVGSSRPMSLSQMISALGRNNVAIPEALYRISLGRFGFPEVHPGALSLLKYPILVDDQSFRNRTGFRPRLDENCTLERFKATMDAPPERSS